MEKLFYDVIYSPDDGGYYAEIYNQQGKNIDDSSILLSIQAVKDTVFESYPDAVFVKIIE